MYIKKVYQLAGLGLLLTLALGIASCSAQTPDAPISSPQEQVGRSIKVYESPT